MSRGTRAVLALYRVALALLPASFRRRHGKEMEDAVSRRLRERSGARTRGATLVHAVAEIADVARVAFELRCREARRRAAAVGARWPGGRRLRQARVGAAASLAVLLLVLAVDVGIHLPGAAPSPPAGPAGTDAADGSLEFRARDPAGRFTLSIQHGRVEAATVDGRSLPGHRVLHVGDSILLLRRDGRRAVSVHFDPAERRIRWEPRPGPPADAVRVIGRVSEVLDSLGPEIGPDIWPGFRPDTIPVRFVIREAGALLAGWRGALPEGYRWLEGRSPADSPRRSPTKASLAWRPGAEPGAASTGSGLAGRRIAQVVVADPAFLDLLGTTVHEGFHVFSWSRSEEGQWFGTSENSFLVSRYPVFDVENERDVVLEGLLLREALSATGRQERLRRVAEFLAIRESRHRRLGHELAGFEVAAEMNEGLAEYALVRIREAAAPETSPAPEEGREARTGAATSPLDRFGAAHALGQLRDLAGEPGLSIRARFYSTGAAMALLLDGLAGPDWKSELMRENLSLQDALASATRYRERELRLRRTALSRHEGPDLLHGAADRIDSLRVLRRARADEILSEPGLLVVISMEQTGGSIGLCGMDPQNMLQGPDGLLLHTRWLRPCAGPALSGELNTPSVHDREAGTLSAVAGPEEGVRVSAGGRAVELADGDTLRGAEDVVVESDRLVLRSARADLRRRGRRLEVVPHGR